MPASQVERLVSMIWERSSNRAGLSARATCTGQTTTASLVRGLSAAGMREFLLYLPLYNGVSSVEVGVPAVEFGPIGGGHHGPEEWGSISSLHRYRQALGDFVRGLPAQLAERDDPQLRAVEGGLA